MANRRTAPRLLAVLAMVWAMVIGGGTPLFAQSGAGRVVVGAMVEVPGELGLPFVADVCVRLQGGEIDQTGCTVEVNQSSAIFETIPVGEYTISLDSARPGCGTDDLPVAVTVNDAETTRVDPVFTCDLATLTVQVAECPAGNTGDLGAACQGDALPNAHFRTSGKTRSVLTTDAAGMGSVLLVGGTNTVEEYAMPAGRYLGVYASCVDQGSGSVLYDGMTDDGQFVLDLPPGGNVTCEVANLIAPTAAQLDVQLFAITCETDPGAVSPTSGDFPPDGCEAAAGVGMAVTDDAGADIGSCVTGAAGGCTIQSADGSSLIVTEDEETAPSGYGPRENPIAIEANAASVAVVFVNLPLLAPQPTATHGAVIEPTETPLPATARPVHIHGGVCPALTRDDSIELNPLIPSAEDATPVGATGAIVAESSFTVIDVSLDELLASPHAINVHASRTAMRAYLVCGEIGGVRGADGSLAIGLREQRGSGYAGIAYLMPDPNDPAKTDIWVFIAPRLAEEEQATRTATMNAATPVASPRV